MASRHFPAVVVAALSATVAAQECVDTCVADGCYRQQALAKEHQLLQLHGQKAQVSSVDVFTAPGQFSDGECQDMHDVKRKCSANSCKVLATKMRGKTCNAYCASNGRACLGAWEEQQDNCAVKAVLRCDQTYGDTSDLICECSPQRGSGTAVSGSSPRKQPSQLRLVWSDDFDGHDVDASKWEFVVGGGGFGNQELQFYSDRSQNARIENGILKIEAKCENYKGSEYTSAKLQTKHKASWGPGHRVDVRARLPVGKGTWPAIWMLPVENVYGGWPKSGEIDIAETVGCTQGKLYGTVHTEAYNHMKHTEKFNTLPIEVGAWHTYSIEWTEAGIKWYLDDHHFHTFEPRSHSSDKWPYDREFYLILNVAVGGSWGAYCLHGHTPSCSSSNEFGHGQVMEVDYARVYAL